MGRAASGRAQRRGRGQALPADRGRPLSDGCEEALRAGWRAAVAAAASLSGDLDAAEDAAQDACALALEKWPAEGLPDNPRAWLAGVARHKALDRLRRESRRAGKETAAAMQAPEPGPPEPDADELALIFMCCHPALGPAARVALTLRSICRLDTRDIAAVFLIPEPTVAQRIVRAKRKIRQAFENSEVGLPGSRRLSRSW